MSGRQLLMTRPMLLFFGFFMLGACAGAGVQAWLITVLHTVKGLDLRVASTALFAYMAGSTCGTLVGGWFADRYKTHMLSFAVVLTTISAGADPGGRRAAGRRAWWPSDWCSSRASRSGRAARRAT